MSCVWSCIKWLLFVFNLLFALCGLAILVVGVLLYVDLKNYRDVLDENVLAPPVTLIVIGSIIFVIAFFGCCGAIRESHCMTITFAAFLLTILIIQVAIAIYTFVILGKEDIDVRSAYAKFFHNYHTDPAQREIIDTIQNSFRCCGVDSYKDFKNFSNGTIPWSCCNNSIDKACSEFDDTHKIYKDGCAPILKQFLLYAGTVLGGLALGIAAVELTGIIFALCLANSIKNLERRGYRV